MLSSAQLHEPIVKAACCRRAHSALHNARTASALQVHDARTANASHAIYAQAEQIMEHLVTASLPHMPHLDLGTLAAIALALARSDFYTAEVFDIISAAVTAHSSTPGSAAGSPAHGSFGTGASNGLSSVPDEVLEPTVLSLACGFALPGHYDVKLFDEVAQAVITRPQAFAHMKALVNVFGAMLDVQHYAPALLDTVGDAALQRMGDMDRADVVSLLLSLAFFRRASHPWVVEGLGELVARYELWQQQQRQQQQQQRQQQQLQQLQTWLTPREALLLYRAMVLLRSQGVAVPVTIELVSDLMFLVVCSLPCMRCTACHAYGSIVIV